MEMKSTTSWYNFFSVATEEKGMTMAEAKAMADKYEVEESPKANEDLKNIPTKKG